MISTEYGWACATVEFDREVNGTNVFRLTRTELPLPYVGDYQLEALGFEYADGYALRVPKAQVTLVEDEQMAALMAFDYSYGLANMQETPLMRDKEASAFLLGFVENENVRSYLCALTNAPQRTW